MSLDHYKSTPPESAEEWQRLHRMLAEWEKSYPLLQDGVKLVNGLGMIKRLTPWAVGVTVVVTALYRSGTFASLLP